MICHFDISKYHFRSQPLLESLNQGDLLLFKENLKLVRFARGVEMFKEGSKPKAVYILKRGKVKIYQKKHNGDIQIIYIYTTGEMFGFRPLLCNEVNFASAMTLEECEVYILEKKHFLQVVSKSIGLTTLLLQNLSHEFIVMINLITAYSHKSTIERIALSLLIFEEKYRQIGINQTQITISRSDMAAYADTTIETVARIVSKLREDKIIKITGRKINIVDALALRHLAE